MLLLNIYTYVLEEQGINAVFYILFPFLSNLSKHVAGFELKFTRGFEPFIDDCKLTAAKRSWKKKKLLINQ
jgi:hypothetical protein